MEWVFLNKAARKKAQEEKTLPDNPPALVTRGLVPLNTSQRSATNIPGITAHDPTELRPVMMVVIFLQDGFPRSIFATERFNYHSPLPPGCSDSQCVITITFRNSMVYRIPVTFDGTTGKSRVSTFHIGEEEQALMRQGQQPYTDKDIRIDALVCADCCRRMNSPLRAATQSVV